MASPSESVSVRPMRLKVLYTFDPDSKNNCLARWPEVLDVQTAFVDDLTQIGVVDLRTCLQALVSSSPELLSQDALDYTVYAFDYSEEGTPLSGQGMLSSVFDQNIQNESAEAAAKVITGRVTKNVMGIFSGNGQETLEVKLRLLPVARQTHQRRIPVQPSQHEYNGSTYQSADDEEWSNVVANDNQSIYTRRSTGSGSPVDKSGLENMHRILHEGSIARDLSANRSSEALHMSSSSRPGTRAGTPGQGQPFNPHTRQSVSQPSRPSSRNSVRGAPQPISHKRRESFNSGYYSGDEVQMEEGPQRKRARVTQVGAPSRSDLNIERQPESLRMAASTASSVRVHRPVALNPTLGNLQGNNLGAEPMRPPTPVPSAQKPGVRRHYTESSSLRRGSQLSLQPEVSFAGQALDNATEASATSPDFARAPSIASTPANIPSSPPIMASYETVPSSPMLPPPPAEPHDFGLGRGWDDLIDTDNNPFIGYVHGDSAIDLRHPSTTVEQSGAIDNHNQSTPAFGEGNLVGEEAARVTLGPPPKPVNQPAPGKRPPSRAQTSRPALRPGMSSPRLAPAPYPRARQLEEEMAAQPSLPPVAASDPVGRPLQRANTWAGEMSDAPMSDAPAGEAGRAKSGSKKKVGREQTKARLENAILHQEIPPYCDNCGTIETPAWRRVFARTFPGNDYDSVQILPETPGAYVWKQIVDQAEDGSIAAFRAYKLAKSPEDKGDEWTNVTLCNPCGLWFHKNKCMRPEEKWSKNPKDPNQKKKRAYRPKSKRVAAKKGQDDDSKSDAPDQGSEGSSPADGATEAELDVDEDQQRRDAMIDPQLLPVHEPASDAATKATAAHLPSAGFEIQSLQTSSIQHDGSHSHPATADLTPKPLRRLLFPSPTNKSPSNTQAASTKHSPSNPLSELPNFCRRSPRLNKSVDMLSTHPKTPDPAHKENCAFTSAERDDLNDLFNDEDDGFLLPPQTPTPTRRSDRLLLKTPTQTPSKGHLRTPGSRTTPTAHRALQGLQEMKTPKRDFIMGSNRTLEEMTPGTRQIHDILVKEATAKEMAKAAAQAPTAAPETPSAQPSDDFPDLPSLEGMSPGQLASFDEVAFSAGHMDFNNTYGAHQQMMHSPPEGYYNFLNSDFQDAAFGGGQWDGTGDMDGQTGTNGYLPGSQSTLGLRRSPRKNKLG